MSIAVVVAVGHGANEFACVEQTLSRVLPVCIRCGDNTLVIYGQGIEYLYIYSTHIGIFVFRTARVTITKYCEFNTYILFTHTKTYGVFLCFLLNFHPKSDKNNRNIAKISEKLYRTKRRAHLN